MDRIIVVIDLDETLLRTDKTYDRERFKAIVQQLHEENSIVCIATGNSYHKIPDYFDEEARRDIYFACDNGNYIIKNEEVLHRTGLTYGTFNDIIDFVDEFEGFYPLVSTGVKAYFRKASGPEYEHVLKYNNHVEIIDSFRELPQDSLATKIAIYGPEGLGRNKIMVRILSEKYEEAEAVTSGDQWLDVYIEDGGKGSAIKYLQEKYEVDKSQTIAFGDSLNDQSMMGVAKYGVAMGNGDHDLILSASYKIGTNNDQAVIDVLENYLRDGNFDFMSQFPTH